MRTLIAGLFLVALSPVVVGLGCGSSSRDPLTQTPDGSVAPDDASADVAPFSDVQVGDPFCGGDHCSSDMHSYVSCAGTVLRTCAPDQGCTPDGCLPACEATRVTKSSVGCEYFVVQPDVIFAAAGGCFATFVANTWTTPAKITFERDGTTLDPSTFGYLPKGTGQNITYTPLTGAEIPPGEVAIFFLSQSPSFVPGTACPSSIKAALSVDAAQHGTGLGRAFHMTASVPVVAYDIFPYGGGSSALTSATLLLPTSAWDTNYVHIDAWTPNAVEQSVLAVAAANDATEVTIQAKNGISGGPGIDGGAANTPTTYTLDRGQVLQLVQPASLAGSIIQSNKPVGVWGANTGLTIDTCCGESSHQQIPPVHALGSEYVGVRYRNRYDNIDEAPPWRILGAVKETKLDWDPVVPPGAPTVIGPGELVTFRTGFPFAVRSQDPAHPFYLSGHMTGAGQFDPSGKDGRGDAEFVNVVPALEYLDSYVFFADPTYPETDLVVIRRRGNIGFSDVVLDCAGPLTGWQPVGNQGRFEFTRVDLVRGNFQPQGKCDNGRHEMHSETPFGVTVWGWGSAASGSFSSTYVSYAYPAGAGAAPINDVVVSPIK
ncbi:MAG: IgGFc-binding protein [Polyangiaceae bacterium]